MNYQQFKQMIELTEEVDLELYHRLIDINGIDKIHGFFERYLKDPSVEDSEDKFKRTAIYLENITNAYDKESFMDVLTSIPDFDITTLYLKEINSIPLFTKDEEVKMALKIKELKEKLKEKSITKKNINAMLTKLGIYKPGKVKDKLTILENKFNELTINVSMEQKFQIEELKNKMELYSTYEALINEFMSHNLRLVVFVAKKYINRGVPFLDLIQEGNLGLKRAVVKFKVEKGYKFSTYATYWIRQAITRSIANDGKSIRVPASIYEILKKIKYYENYLEEHLLRKPTDLEILNSFKEKAILELEKEGIKNPTQDEINKKTNLDLDNIKELRKLLLPEVSLYAPIGEDKESVLVDFIEDPEEETTEAIVLKNLDKERLIELVQRLDLRTQLVIILRNGLDLDKYMSYEDFTEILNEYNTVNPSAFPQLYYKYSNSHRVIVLEEVAKLFDLTRERIRQLEAKGIRRLSNLVKRDKILEKV